MTVKIELLKSEIEALKSQVFALKNNEKQLELVIQSTGMGIWDWYVQTGKTTFNERWANIIGYTLDELSPISIETWKKYAHPDDLKESNRLLKQHWAGETEYYIYESRMKHRNGHLVWVYDTGQVIEWESNGVPKRMIGTHLDITDKKEAIAKLDEANKQLKEWSYIDSLTKIPNRRAYEEKLVNEIEAAKRSNKPLSLLIIDIDNFKEFNDDYGHEKGDDALFKVAQAIRKALPRKTDFVARYGGEEMVVILPYTSRDGAAVIANNVLHRVMSESIEHAFSKFNGILTVSIGVSSTDTMFEQLFEHADTALYGAKDNGRNRYVISAKV
ncbi:MAG: diguanylate cyclase (GGDEF)-like protein/PAS domain S-box-containing protein [Paraglaciecola sp.]|jgi:diguanylate cyclase (GGDEF)-like protein/PAS domain S-box-containing protein